MADILDFPNSIAPDMFGTEIRGHSLIIEGRVIPNFRIIKTARGVEFILDNRFSYEFPEEWAWLAAAMASQAMAIGAGYSYLGAESKEQPFAPQLMQIAL